MGGNLAILGKGRREEKTALNRNDAGLFIECRASVYNDFIFHKQDTVLLVQGTFGKFCFGSSVFGY